MKAWVKVRATFRLARVGAHLGYGVATVAVAYPFLPRKVRVRLKQRWSRQLLQMLGVRLCLEGTGRPGRTMIVANHISWLDIFAINAVAPSAFVCKVEVRAWPVIGWLCASAETIFIERGRAKAAQRTAENVKATLQSGRTVAFFPEGTTSDGSVVLPFRAALLQPAIDCAATLQPVSICYADRQGRPSVAPAYCGETSFGESLKRIATADSLSVRLSLLAPVEACRHDRRSLAASAHASIVERLNDGRIDTPGRHATPGIDAAQLEFDLDVQTQPELRSAT
jgi:1-acyl-sn-glycerol-3-phosphate acyltransferase